MSNGQELQERASISRAKVNHAETEPHIAAFRSFLKQRLAKEMESFDPTHERTTRTTDTGIVREDSRRYLEAWAADQALRPPQALRFTVQPGERLIGPPYEAELSEGSGNVHSFTSRNDGKLGTISTEGFSSSGVGIFLESPIALDAAVKPLGNSEFSWLSAGGPSPNLRSRGGVGIAVHEIGGPAALVERMATLWSVVGTTGILQGDNGGGPIADAVVATTPFGHMLLAPALFRMQPGKLYLILVWLWQTFAANGDDGFICFQNAQVPAFVVSARSPTYIG
ncbi:hypothetical protein GCM10010869_48730 [Mesorhizobium tianshanense]|uniref:Uncharacterized protein n=1 Tax=Mesorhizobium tianshanense TaxID=39844 RepID=A0A562NT27_9HYPH|nr:hypothetical protein [Mesorhizobium tianshanense]TWI35368.1 hypothetical protein IQ26_03349 [Mesorhizobium tianshanense]GLS39276.1 hypothetical protein GCM10010869_48730 [Mesorhizobium tianshanense]